jgi:Domain of unknown function (DUF4440)
MSCGKFGKSGPKRQIGRQTVIIEGKRIRSNMKQTLISLAACAALLTGTAPAQQPASSPSGESPEITQFQKLEDQWSDALVKRDQYGLENLMSPVYIDISSGGDITTRNQQIALLYEKSGPQPVSMEQRVVNVRTIEDVTVVDGTYIQKWKVNGVVHEERGIFTHVYQHARGTWVCVNSQRTPVVEKGDEKTSKQAKKSNADLPFHIPLLFKGKDSTQPAPAPGSDPAPQQ